jgi:acyl-CoA synthetase (AMP-forming)/AMP-acid ligase II
MTDIFEPGPAAQRGQLCADVAAGLHRAHGRGVSPAPGRRARCAAAHWGEVYARCRQLASALQRAGMGKGDTVAVMLPNTPPMVEAHFGIPMAGAVLNALNTRLDPETVAFMLDHGEAKVVIVDPEFAPHAKASACARPPRRCW